MTDAALERESGAGAPVGAGGFVAAPVLAPTLGLRLSDAARHLAADIRRDWQLYVLLAPMLIWFVVFLYKPMYGLQIAFKDYSLFRGIDGQPMGRPRALRHAVRQRLFPARDQEHGPDQLLQPRLRASRCRSSWP